MDTVIANVEDKEPVNETEIKKAAGIIRSGGLVAFPTETVYGLGGNALDAEAAAKIYAAKGRPGDNPLIVHIADIEDLSSLVTELPKEVPALAKKFWPGPLTLILKKSKKIPYATSGGLDTVAIRMPSDPIARALIRLSGVPIAAPSANTSGRPSPTTAKHVMEDLFGRIEMIIDGGPVGIGLESTIVDLTSEQASILRPGAVTMSDLKEVIGKIEQDPGILNPSGKDVHPKAPGMKYRHYAPKAELVLVSGDRQRVAEFINRKVEEAELEGKRAGIIAAEESKSLYKTDSLKVVGLRKDEKTIAHNLFATLREFDESSTDIIYSESFDEDGIGQAIMNRLRKASGYHSVQV